MTADVERTIEGQFGLGAIFSAFRRVAFGDPTFRRIGETWWRTSRTLDGPVTLAVSPAPGRVVFRAWGPGAAWPVARAEALLGTHDDASGFVAEHPLLVDALRRHPEIRFGRIGEIVDMLIPTILGQRVTVKGAADSWRGLVFRYGDDAPGPEAGMKLPPDPERLAQEPYYRLHEFGIERTRAQCLLEVCRRRKRIEALLDEPVAVASERLRSLRGIGPWTVALVLTASHGDPDAVPVGDFHLPNTVAWAFAGEARGDDDRMVELLAPWAGHRARVLRLLAQAGIGAPKFGPRGDAPDIRDW